MTLKTLKTWRTTAAASHDYDCILDFAETATFFPVGTGVSSARVEAVAVRTSADLGADVRLVVLAPPNEVQPRSYRATPAAHVADSAQSTAAPVTGPLAGASLDYDNFVITAEFGNLNEHDRVAVSCA